MRTGRILVIRSMRFLVCCVLIGALTLPQAMSFMSDREGADGTMAGKVSKKKPAFTVKGKVKGLYPGVETTLSLRALNKSPYPIKIKTVSIEVKKPKAPRCKKNWLKIKKKIRPGLKVKRNRGRSFSVPVKLNRKASDACQRARWMLRYSGKAVRS